MGAPTTAELRELLADYVVRRNPAGYAGHREDALYFVDHYLGPSRAALLLAAQVRGLVSYEDTLVPEVPAPDVEVTGGATGLRVTRDTPPTRIGTMTVIGPGSVGIDLGDDDEEPRR